jgi:hypothetical protein
MKIFKIVSPNFGKNISKTQTRIWNIDIPDKIHLSSKSSSWIDKTVPAIHDKIDSIQKTMMIVSRARFGLNIMINPNTM